MIPHYLYHYTTVKGLIDILNSKKIRFKRLDLLNDPYEGYVEIEGLSGIEKANSRFIYCSCWNDLEDEDLALWYIYTKVEGVRIKMKSAMFGKSVEIEEHKSGYFPVTDIEKINTPKGDDIHKVYGPLKICYENCIENTYCNAVGKSIANEGSENEFIMNDIDLSELGVRKMKHWSYENEWRYKISPYIEVHGSDSAFENNLANDRLAMPEYIDVPFCTQIEEIMLAPQISIDDKNTIEKYLDEHKLDIPINPSKIKTRFKQC